MATTMVSETIVPLPSRLLRFFAKYPPQKYSAYATGQRIPTLKQRIDTNAKPLSATNVPVVEALEPEVTKEAPATINLESENHTSEVVSKKKSLPNPFLPWKNPTTGRWRGAPIGLRIQADLFKLAREYGVEELLPPSIKSTDYKQRRVLERGLQVKGTGEGQTVKGHKWERQINATMDKRRKAMEEMPEMIRLWKQRGHGRGWKKYPSK